MAVDNATSSGELVAGETHTGRGFAENMHNADATTADQDFALDRQGKNNLLGLNIALHRYNGRYGLQLVDHPQNREIARVNYQLDTREMLPDDFQGFS